MMPIQLSGLVRNEVCSPGNNIVADAMKSSAVDTVLGSCALCRLKPLVASLEAIGVPHAFV